MNAQDRDLALQASTALLKIGHKMKDDVEAGGTDWRQEIKVLSLLGIWLVAISAEPPASNN